MLLQVILMLKSTLNPTSGSVKLPNSEFVGDFSKDVMVLWLFLWLSFSLWGPTGPPSGAPVGAQRVWPVPNWRLQAPGFGSAGSALVRLSAGFFLGFRLDLGLDFGWIWAPA